MEYKSCDDVAKTAEVSINLQLNESSISEVTEKGFGRKN
jgi:hypothetical protein